MIALLMLLAQASEQVPVQFEVIGHALLAEVTDEDGTVTSVPAERMPNSEALCYRWVLKVKPVDAVVQIEERMELPAPADWGGSERDPEDPTRISADGRVATTPIFFSLKSGQISHSWCLDESDPGGAYTIAISHQNRLLHRFRFTVVDEANDDDEPKRSSARS